MKKILWIASVSFLMVQCTSMKVKPVYKTQKVQFDTDDPAFWINPHDASKSLILGTDKETNGGIYVYDLKGKIVNKVLGIQRPNNIDVEYGLEVGGKKMDIAIFTERETNKIRVFSVPDLKPIDNGGISVFEDSDQKSPMGIALYKNPATQQIYAVVGRKTGPSGSYLYQYLLKDDGNGQVIGELVRKFGEYSGKKEIESIAVDDALGVIYYSDEQYGIHKYNADPSASNEQLALFGTNDFKSDIEGISIYPTGEKTGYILVSDQQANTFNVYRREGDTNENTYQRIAIIPVSTKESDGSDVSNVNFGPDFPKGMFVAMSNGKVFHIYDWRDIEALILAQQNKK